MPKQTTRTTRKRIDGKPDRRSVTSASNGKNGGRPENPIDLQAIQRAAILKANGVANDHLIKGQLPPPKCTWLSLADRISPEAAAWLKRVVGVTPEQFRDELGQRLEGIIAQIVSTLETQIEHMSGRDLALSFGILNDHLMKTRGFGTSLTLHQTNISINGMNRADALAAIAGKRPGDVGQMQTGVNRLTQASRTNNAQDAIDLPLSSGSTQASEPAQRTKESAA